MVAKKKPRASVRRSPVRNPAKDNAARSLFIIGDVNPEYGSGVVYRDKYGVHVTRWDVDDDDSDDFRKARVTVHSFDVPDDVLAYHSWAKASDIASSHGASVADVRRASKSRSIRDRVWVLEMIGGHYGYDNLDNYPNETTGASIMRQWGNTFTRRGSKTGRSPKRGAGGRFA